jgi:hypothetical protein
MIAFLLILTLTSTSLDILKLTMSSMLATTKTIIRFR